MLNRAALTYSYRQLAQRAGITGVALNSAGLETLGVSVQYVAPKQHAEGKPTIFIVPCKESAWLELLNCPDNGLHWVSEQEVTPRGAVLPFDAPVPVLCWGAGYEDGTKPFVVRREDGSVVFYADILAATFFMLSRWEETVVPVRDQHDRFPATASVACKQGFLDRPIIDEYALILQAWLKTLLPGWEPKPKQFSVRLSHDIDKVRSFSSLYAAGRNFTGDLLKRRSLRKAVQTVQAFFNPNSDPAYPGIFELARVSEKYGFKSAFYFMAADPGAYNSGYDLAAPQMRLCIDELSRRGHEIGFHPSYQASFDAKVWQKELTRLRAATNGVPIYGGRQHFLRFRVPDTWRIWEEAGMKYDSTMTYAEHEGFRGGTCHSFRPFDIEHNREMDITEVPLIIMEGTLRQYRGLTPEEAEEKISALANRCKQVNGVFTLLWHNASLQGEWKAWANIYCRIVAVLAAMEGRFVD